MLDKDYTSILRKTERCSLILNNFKKEWPEFDNVELFEGPIITLRSNKFIIQVPLMNSKVQYIPFIYGKLPVEIKA